MNFLIPTQQGNAESVYRFHEIFDSESGVTSCAGGATSSASSSVSRSGRPSRSKASGAAQKRQKPEEEENADNDGDDGRDKRRKQNGGHSSTQKKSERLLACPYFKHNPSKYQDVRTCQGPGWGSVRRVK